MAVASARHILVDSEAQCLDLKTKTEEGAELGELEKVDLAAESILDFIAIEMERELKSRRKKIGISGRLPKDKYLNRFLRVIGIIKNMRIKHEYLAKEDDDKLEVLKVLLIENLKSENHTI